MWAWLQWAVVGYWKYRVSRKKKIHEELEDMEKRLLEECGELSNSDPYRPYLYLAYILVAIARIENTP